MHHSSPSDASLLASRAPASRRPRRGRSLAALAAIAPLIFAVGCAKVDESKTPVVEVDPPAPRTTPADLALIEQLHENNDDLAGVAARIAGTGDSDAMQRAGGKLVSIAKQVGAKEWRDTHRSEFRSGSASPAALSDDKALEAELVSYQTEKLAPIYAAMDALGGDVVVDYALGEASDKTLPAERRLLALHVLEHHVDRSDGLRAPRVASLETDMDRLDETPTAHVPKEQAMEVLTTLAPSFRDCLQKAIAVNPNLETSGTLSISVAASGEVEQASLPDMQPRPLAQCLEDVAKKAKFTPVSGGVPFTIRIPMSFHPKH